MVAGENLAGAESIRETGDNGACVDTVKYWCQHHNNKTLTSGLRLKDKNSHTHHTCCAQIYSFFQPQMLVRHTYSFHRFNSTVPATEVITHLCLRGQQRRLTNRNGHRSVREHSKTAVTAGGSSYYQPWCPPTRQRNAWLFPPRHMWRQ